MPCHCQKTGDVCSQFGRVCNKKIWQKRHQILTNGQDSSEECRCGHERFRRNEKQEGCRGSYNDSNKEVAEAEKFLKEAECRWKVFAINADNEAEENESCKKQKVAVEDIILVEGRGLPVSGICKCSGDLYGGAHVYCKQGQWKGGNATHEICHQRASQRYWFIYVTTKHNCFDLYHGPKGGSPQVPSNNDWKIFGYGTSKGVNPPPALKCM